MEKQKQDMLFNSKHYLAVKKLKQMLTLITEPH